MRANSISLTCNDNIDNSINYGSISKETKAMDKETIKSVARIMKKYYKVGTKQQKDLLQAMALTLQDKSGVRVYSHLINQVSNKQRSE